MAPLRYASKFDPFLSLDCAPTPSTLAQSRERKGTNFAIWQPMFLVTAFQTKICAVDEVVTASDIDTFVLVFVGWFAFGGLVLAAVHFLLRNDISSIEPPFEQTYMQFLSILYRGDHSGCDKPPVDIKTKVQF